MAKRIVTKIGDIFCVELGNGYKSYFQYIANDMTQLNSSVIRAFVGRYPMDYKPDMDELVKSEVAFYAHTIIKSGVQEDVFHKYGKSADLGLDELEAVFFGIPSVGAANPGPGGIILENPAKNWIIGKYNYERQNIGCLPPDLKPLIECDGVLSYKCIVDRIRCGYYIGAMPFYDEVKREPWPWADSYVRLADRLTRTTTYFHFHGSRAVREVIVDCDGNMSRLSCENPSSGCHTLYAGDFGEINWRYDEFITADVFEEIWNKSDKSR